MQVAMMPAWPPADAPAQVPSVLYRTRPVPAASTATMATSWSMVQLSNYIGFLFRAIRRTLAARIRHRRRDDGGDYRRHLHLAEGLSHRCGSCWCSATT